MKVVEYESFLAADIKTYLKKKDSELKSECGKISLAHHLRHFDKYIVCSGCTEITESVITGWIETLSNLSDGTKNNYICDVQGLLIFINTWKRTYYFIPSLIKEDDLYVPHLFSDEEKHRFYERIDNYEPGVAIKLPWIKAELPMVIRICDGCGTRIGEILALKMENVNLKTGVLTLINTKNNKQRYAPMSQDLTMILRQYCGAMGITDQPNACLFPGRSRNECLAPREINQKFVIILRGLGIYNRTLLRFRERGPCVHNLRHTFAVNCLPRLWKAGIELDDSFSILSVYLGHENLRETMKYLKFCVEVYPEEMKRIESIMDSVFTEEDLWEKYGL